MSLDTAVTAYFGLGDAAWTAVDTEPCVGIELEYERAVVPSDWRNSETWTLDRDGSLRDSGIELISCPLAFEETDDALEEAEGRVATLGGIATERCGIHVHMNMRVYTLGQMWSIMALYGLLEPTIFETYAEGRKDSIFCVPLFQQQSQQQRLSDDIRNIRLANGRRTSNLLNANKYSALNTGRCLSQFGTLEMRQPYSTNNFDAIRSWVQFCKRLMNTGAGYNDPLHVLDEYYRSGLGGMQESMFGDIYAIDEEEQEQAEDAVAFLSGYDEPTWNELTWETPMMEAV